jgi:hypothetical protein
VKVNITAGAASVNLQWNVVELESAPETLGKSMSKNLVRFDFSKHLTPLLGLCIVVLLALIIWGLDKGFDAYDEGLYLMHALPGQENVNHTFWWIYIRFFFGASESSVVANRTARLVMTLVSNSFFSLGFWQWFKTHLRKDRGLWPGGLVILFTFFGGLISFIHGPLSYSYNHMNSHFLLLASGCFLFLLSRNPLDTQSKTRPNLLWILVGSLIGFQFFVKYPSAILVISIFTGIMFFSYPQDNKRKILLKVGGFGLGFLISVLVSIYLMGGTQLIENYFSRVPSFGTSGTSLSRHTPVFLLFFSYLEFFNEMKYTFTYYLPFFMSIYLLILLIDKGIDKGILLIIGALQLVYFVYVTFLTARHEPYATFQLTNLFFLGVVLLGCSQKIPIFPLYGRLLPKVFWWKIPLFAVALVPPLYFLPRLMAWQDPWMVNLHKMIFSFLVSLILFGIVLYVERVWQIFRAIFRNEKSLVTIFLLLLPLMGSFGTNTGLIEKAIDTLPLWFAVMVILLHEVSQVETIPYGYRKTIMGVFVAFLVFTTSVQIVYGYEFYPYHLNENRLKQDFEVKNSDRLRGIKLDQATSQFYEGLITLVTENTSFAPLDPIIGLFDIPGMVYAVGGMSPGKAFFPLTTNLESACQAIGKTKMKNLNQAIILSMFELNRENADCFLDFNIDITKNYQLLDVIEVPYEYLHKRGQDFLYVYAPRSFP